MYYNVITKIGKGRFGTNITAFSMFGTYIQRLSNGLFSGLPKLKYLGIVECGIESIGEDVLNGTAVRIITLDRNPIKLIDENAFQASIATTFACVDCQLL